MNIKYIKFAADIAVTLGVSKVVRDIIQNQVVIETGLDQAQVMIGSFVIGGMVAEQAREHTHRQIDTVAGFFEKKKDDTEDK